jgi:DNA-directed RNA polymerase beta' subunit
MPRPQYSKMNVNIKIDWPADVEWESDEEKQYCTQIFTAREALSILTHVPDEDYIRMGFQPSLSHPKNMIQTVIVIPPPITRPAVTQSEGSRSRGQNDLTHKMQDILKKCIDLKNYIPDWRNIKITTELHERILKLQLELFTIVNNTVRGQKTSTQRSGNPTKSYMQRLKGKDGRIRGNLMGKRVDFSARSVITPCPNMDIDQVGVPEKIALTLTISERVTPYNIESLIKRIRTGAGKINGADSIMYADGTVIQLEQCKNIESINIKHGDIVERYLQDDDIVVFNRQPSLHRMSMLGHRVKLMPGLTFRLNVVCTSPYNADFDGDEMNLHVPRSPAAVADVTTLMMVSQQIISPQSNKPVMGIVQDGLLGCHVLCKDDIFLDHMHACLVCSNLKYATKILPLPCIRIHGKPYWTGKQILSILFPKNMTIDLAKIETLDDDLEQLIVRRGQMLCGNITKNVLGSSSGGIIDVLCRDFGHVDAAHFMSDVQRLANAFILQHGFSVGVSDCILTSEGHDKVRERLEKATTLCEEISKEMYQDNTPEHVVQNAESTILRILSKTLMQTGSIVNDYVKDNAIKCMVNCKSKGSPINLSQIMGLVGQQSVEGGRIMAGKGDRTLPCFGRNERSLSSQGFVLNSYALGLLPSEFFFHSMGGREGLVDTAVKTSVTGYIQRRQVKSMEDLKVHYDGTVRDANDMIVDFSYGGDGMDPVKLERVKLPLLEESIYSMKERMNDIEFHIAFRAKQQLLSTRFLVTMPIFDNRVLLPFHPIRLLQSVKRTSQISEQIGQEEAHRRVMELIVKCETNTLRAAIVDFFCSKRMSTILRTDFYNIMNIVEQRLNTSKIHPGEMVGSLAAQSVGEPATQMSIRGDEHVLIRTTGGIQSVTIAEVVDSHIEGGISPNFQVMGVSPKGCVKWAYVTGVSRHPANGHMIRIVTKTGRTVVATASHSFLTRSLGNRVVAIRGDALNIGDVTPVIQTYPSTEEEARHIGKTFALCQHYISTKNTHFLDWLMNSHERCRSFLQGLVEHSEPMGTVTVHDDSASTVHMVATKLQLFIQVIKKPQHTIFIFNQDQIQEWTQQILWDPIVVIEKLGISDETVYDFSVEEELQSFMLTNGLFTHNTLNTFHFAGCASKNVTLGIPRLKEILDVTKNPKTPSTTIRFKKPFSNSFEFVNYFADTLPLTRLGDIVTSCNVINEPAHSTTIVEQDAWIVDTYNILYGNEPCTENSESTCVVRLELNQALMKTRRLTPPIVRRLLQKRLGNRANVVSSETNAIEWIIRIRFSKVGEMMKKIGMNTDREAVLCHRVVSTLLETMALSGHPDIRSANVIEIESERLDDNLHIIKEKEYAVSTLGDCFIDCSASPCVSWEETTSNNITNILDILGVEGCAAQLFEQLNTVVSFDGTYIDPRHLTMLCNTMTRNGLLMALNRHGINRGDTGPLGKCSFEETPDVLCDAAMFGESDNAKGVSTAIMTGQPAHIGSGCADVLFHSTCLDPRSFAQSNRPKHKPWKSTCRSFINVPDTETVEYVEQVWNVPHISNIQKPFAEADDTSVSARIRFRPTSPV